MRARFILRVLAVVAAIGVLSSFGLSGGALNHLRGGWLPLAQLTSDNYFTHDLVLRLIFAIPTGAVLWIAFPTSRPSACISGAAVAAAICLWGLMSLYTGWGSYFSLGNETSGSQARAGVFDWLVGPPLIATDDNHRQRWLRDAAGMALRGLQQTAVPGFLIAMYSASLRGSAVASSASSAHAWVKAAAAAYALSGAAMALIYLLGQLPSSDGSTAWLGPFQPGIPLSELLWGAWSWMTLAAVFSAFAVAATFAADGEATAGAACCSALPFGGLLQGLTSCCFRCGAAAATADAAPSVREAVLCPCLPLAADDDEHEDARQLEAPKARSGSRASLLPYSGDILAAATGEEQASKLQLSAGGTRVCSRLGCAAQVLFHGFLFAYACVLLASGIWYNSAVTQDDARNKFQSALGVFAVAVPLLAFQVAAGIGCLCIARRSRRAGVSRRQARDQLVVSCCPPCLLCSCAVGVDDVLDDAGGCCFTIPCCAAGRARCLCGRTAARVAGDVGGYMLETGRAGGGSSSSGAGLLGSGLARSFAVAGAGDARQGGSSVSVLYAGGAGGTSGSGAAGREAAFLDAVDAAIGANSGSNTGYGRSALSGVEARARGRSRGRSSMAIAAVTAKYSAVGAVNADRAAEYSAAASAGAAAGAISPPGSPSLYMPLAASAGGLLTAGVVDWGTDGDSQQNSRSSCGLCCGCSKTNARLMLPSTAGAVGDGSDAKERCADACGTGIICVMRSFLALTTVTALMCCVGCVVVILWAQVEN